MFALGFGNARLWRKGYRQEYEFVEHSDAVPHFSRRSHESPPDRCRPQRVSSLPAQETFSPDAEGFIRNWLVLAPIAIEGDSGATEIDKDFLEGEATIKPKPDDKVNVGGKP